MDPLLYSRNVIHVDKNMFGLVLVVSGLYCLQSDQEFQQLSSCILELSNIQAEVVNTDLGDNFSEWQTTRSKPLFVQNYDTLNKMS
jgi:hypothetical protein